MAAGDAESEDAPMAKLKMDLRALLISAAHFGSSAEELQQDYLTLNGRPLPTHGFGSVRALLAAMPDVARQEGAASRSRYFAVSHESTRHLERLVDGQRVRPTGRIGGVLPQNVLKDKLKHDIICVLLQSGPLTPEELVERYVGENGDASTAKKAFGVSLHELVTGQLLADVIQMSEDGSRVMLYDVKAPDEEPLRRAASSSCLPRLFAGPELAQPPMQYVRPMRMPVFAAFPPMVPAMAPPLHIYLQRVLSLVRLAAPKCVPWSLLEMTMDFGCGVHVNTLVAYGRPSRQLMDEHLPQSCAVIDGVGGVWAIRWTGECGTCDATTNTDAVSVSADVQPVVAPASHAVGGGADMLDQVHDFGQLSSALLSDRSDGLPTDEFCRLVETRTGRPPPLFGCESAADVLRRLGVARVDGRGVLHAVAAPLSSDVAQVPSGLPRLLISLLHSFPHGIYESRLHAHLNDDCGVSASHEDIAKVLSDHYRHFGVEWNAEDHQLCVFLRKLRPNPES